MPRHCDDGIGGSEVRKAGQICTDGGKKEKCTDEDRDVRPEPGFRPLLGDVFRAHHILLAHLVDDVRPAPPDLLQELRLARLEHP